MKKLFLVTLICFMVFSFAACKSPDEVVEDDTIKESAEEDFSLGDDGFNYEGESGEEVNVGGNKWPTDMIAEHMPKLDAGEVTASYNSPDSCILTVNNVKKDQFEDYLDEVKNSGYTKNPLDISQGETIHYYADN